jgi:hypothetical protein
LLQGSSGAHVPGISVARRCLWFHLSQLFAILLVLVPPWPAMPYHLPYSRVSHVSSSRPVSRPPWASPWSAEPLVLVCHELCHDLDSHVVAVSTSGGAPAGGVCPSGGVVRLDAWPGVWGWGSGVGSEVLPLVVLPAACEVRVCGGGCRPSFRSDGGPPVHGEGGLRHIWSLTRGGNAGSTSAGSTGGMLLLFHARSQAVPGAKTAFAAHCSQCS